MRRIIVLMLLMSVCALALSNCVWFDREYDRKKRGLIERIEPDVFVYQGEEYYNRPEEYSFVFSNDQKEFIGTNYTLVSWNYNYPFTHTIQYYSYSAEHPDFIIEPYVMNKVWFKASYDYTKEVFCVENTDIEIVFSDAFEDTKINAYNLDVKTQSFYWHVKAYDILKMKVKVFRLDGIYYMNITNTKYAYRISDEFLALLIENGIIVAS